MHRLLAQQLTQATDEFGCVDVVRFCRSVDAIYQEFYRDRSRAEDAITRPLEELEHVHRDLEKNISDRAKELRGSEDELNRIKTFLHSIIENMPIMVTVKDAKEQRYVLMNQNAEDLFGIPRHAVIGKRLHEIFPKEAADFFYARDLAVLKSGGLAVVGEHEVTTPNRGKRVLSTKKLVICGEDGSAQYLLSLSEDITEQKEAQRRIAYMAHHDTLTDLPNRAAFNERLQSLLARSAADGKQFALLCLDLDRFKEVNDVFGHLTGDALLREVSRRFHTAADGAFLARLGGDEFGLLVCDESVSSQAAILADRLRQAVAEEIEIAENLMRIGVSIGVSIYPDGGADAESIVANADAALYRAKHEGPNAIRFFEVELDKQLRERRALQHELREAIKRRELVVYYQPLSRMNGEVVGFEALVRWNHPTRGLVPPSGFIPAAEESGLIVEMNEWVLAEACREAASWPRPLQIAVNLSPIQFRHGDLPTRVHQALLQTGLKPSRLELEITEGILIGDFSRAVSILRRIKLLGVRISMDDFGTGYSSLSYLQAFPFDKIKIDRSFVSNVEHNDQSLAIIRAVIGLAKGLNLPVLAEGVENKHQLEQLRKQDCDQVQGYYLGRPQPIDAYADLIGCPHHQQGISRTAC